MCARLFIAAARRAWSFDLSCFTISADISLRYDWQAFGMALKNAPTVLQSTTRCAGVVLLLLKSSSHVESLL
jgi:hypothetical protein